MSRQFRVNTHLSVGWHINGPLSNPDNRERDEYTARKEARLAAKRRADAENWIAGLRIGKQLARGRR